MSIFKSVAISAMNDLEPSDPLDNAQRERFCQLMAKGKSSQGQCYAIAYGRDEVDDTAYNNASSGLRYNPSLQFLLLAPTRPGTDKAKKSALVVHG